MATQTVCTIGDLVQSPALQLRPRGPAAPPSSVSVASAQIVALSQHIETFGEGELILVTGWQPAGQEEIDHFVSNAVEAKVAAVAFSELSLQQYGSSLIPALESVGTPVLEVPQATRFADVIDTISRFHATPDSARFHRLLTMQQSLVASMGIDDPQSALVKKLAKLAGGSVGIIRISGDVVQSEGILPFHLLNQEIGGSPHPETEINTAGWNALAIRLGQDSSRPPQWLIVGARREQFIDPFVRAAARVTASLLNAIERMDHIATHQARAVRSSILKQLLEAQPHENIAVLAERVTSLGFTFTQEVRILDVSVFGTSRTTAQRTPLVDRIHQAFDTERSVLLVTGTHASATVLVEARPSIRNEAINKLLAQDAGLLIGVGRALTHVRDVPVSYHDAVLAAQHASRLGNSRLGSYDDFNFATRLLAHVGIDRINEWSSSILGPLRSKPLLMETVEAYFEAELDVMAAAKALHIHHNTMRYRLTKVEELVGGSMRSPEIIASIQMALMSDRAGQKAHSVRPAERPSTSTVRDSAAIDNPLDSHSFPDPAIGPGAVIRD